MATRHGRKVCEEPGQQPEDTNAAIVNWQCVSQATNAEGCLTIKINSIMKEKFSKWMRQNNMTFSAIAGETFTNAEVVYTHIGLVVFIIIAGVVGSF